MLERYILYFCFELSGRKTFILTEICMTDLKFSFFLKFP